MRVTLFGASGRVGKMVMGRLLEQGYDVTAFVHHHSGLPENSKLKVIRGDIYDPGVVMETLRGTDVVVSALGSWGTPKKDILTAAMRNVIPAMEAKGMRRIISLTGADARADGDSLSVLHRLSHAAISLTPGVRRILADGDRHLRLLEASELDWTVIRSPVMNDRGKPGDFRLINRRPVPWSTINRKSVAWSLVNLIDDSSHSRQAPFIVRA